MFHETLQKPFYLSMAESDFFKDLIRRDLAKLSDILNGELDQKQKILVTSAQNILKKALEIDCLKSEDCEGTDGVFYLMNLADLPWSE